MSSHQMTLNFSRLSDQQKSTFLCTLGVGLTVLVRAYNTEIDDQSELAARILGVNEAQHKIFGYLCHIISLSKSGYADDTFVSSLVALSEGRGFGGDFVGAWNLALKAVGEDQ